LHVSEAKKERESKIWVVLSTGGNEKDSELKLFEFGGVGCSNHTVEPTREFFNVISAGLTNNRNPLHTRKRRA
jgi:hypothetical protein